MTQDTAPVGAQERPRRILIVEDEVLVRTVIAEAARDAGYRVTEAGAAQAALDFLASGKVVDLVFTDINLPGMDGVTLARRIKADHPRVKVILTSGQALPAGGRRLGIFIAKPYSIADVLARIGRAIDADAGE